MYEVVKCPTKRFSARKHDPPSISYGSPATPDRTWGGPGVGASCAVCEVPVTKTELEFEIQFAHYDPTPGLDKFHLHVRCFAAWEFERTKPAN